MCISAIKLSLSFDLKGKYFYLVTGDFIYVDHDREY